MAKMIADKRCVLCGQAGVQMWTLDNLQKASVTYLCWEHSKPFMEILEIAGDLPPDKQIPVPDRDKVVESATPKQSKMVPLLDWTPPEEQPEEQGTPEEVAP